MRLALGVLFCLVPLALADLARANGGETGASCPVDSAPEVRPASLSSDVAAAQAAATDFQCTTETITAGTCTYNGIKIDRSCAGRSDADIRALADAIREVRGADGIGCVREMNPAVADALDRVYSSTPPLNVCCGACHGFPDTRITGQACAQANPASGARPRQIVLSDGAFAPTGLCGGARTPKPLHSTLLHEMLHHAGLCGVHNHSSASIVDPDSRRGAPPPPGAQYSDWLTPPLNERDFLPDPIYGCQNSCFGRAPYRTSQACLACAAGVHDPQYEATGASPDTPTNGNPVTQRERQFELEQRLFGGASGAVPDRCRTLAARSSDTGRRRYLARVEGTQIINRHHDAQVACNERFATRSLGSTMSVAEWASMCDATYRPLIQACARFAEHSQCQPNPSSNPQPYPFYTNDVLRTCRRLLSPVQRTMLRWMNAIKTNPNAAQRYTGFRCSDYFPSQPLCGNIDGGSLMPASECAAALPAGVAAQ